MYGAIIGDIIGSPYEFQTPPDKDFYLFSPESAPTDDTIMTIAVGKALLNIEKNRNYSINGESLNSNEKSGVVVLSNGLFEVYCDGLVTRSCIKSMQDWGRYYNRAGYGPFFRKWLDSDGSMPYFSFGNGSAMRVSSVGWLYNTLEETTHIARLTAKVTHNHPEGIKGAECTAGMIFLARNGYTKKELAEYAKSFGYEIKKCKSFPKLKQRDASCMESMPRALSAFFESTDFEDAIRTVVSLGGDTDTNAAITGSIAEAFYGIPIELKEKAKALLSPDIRLVLAEFENFLQKDA